jgi:3-oxoacyl-[acyl-carrier protein] reductase
MRRLDGRTALITGGSRGIGAAIALRLAEEGADVALTYRDGAGRARDVVEQVKARGRRALPLQADSADPGALVAAVDEAAATFGRLDILVNNAALFLTGALEDISLADIDRTLAVNVRAAFLASQAAARHMSAVDGDGVDGDGVDGPRGPRRSGGRIISLGSNVAERAPFPGLALYAMSKAALAGMTRGLARELGPRGITVNLVSPGPTDTDSNPADGPAAAAISAVTALGRYAAPAEVAAAVAHLAAPDAAYITGATLAVDGGFTV